MKLRIALLAVLLTVGLLFNLSLRVPKQAVVRAQAATTCPSVDVPAVTLGANGDSFLLNDPLRLTMLSATGDASFFATNALNFGDNATLTRIAAAGGSAKGITISTVGGKAVAVSCRESFWDINFMLAGMGATAGDKIRLFMQADENGKGAFDLARFDVGNGGANLTYLEPTSSLYGNGHIQQNIGAFLPYINGAGQSGRSTEQITIALSMDAKAPTMACLHLGVEIIRDGGTGTSAIVFNTIVLSRDNATTATGTGLFTGQTGTYPTKAPCDRACPTCKGCLKAPVPATVVGANDDQFLLGNPLNFTLTDANGDADFFATNTLNFGDNATLGRIAAAGRAAQGLRVGGVGSSATAVSCRDSFWDINFMLAGTGTTAGDKIRLFMQADENGKGAFDLARFDVGNGGANLTYLEPSSSFYANGHIQQNTGAFLPFAFPAGGSGNRTDQITIALSMDKNAKTMGCQHLGVEIIRDGGNGNTVIVFNSIVLVRSTATTATGTGLFTGQTGTYPTKAECDGACPSCCPTANIPATTVGTTESFDDQFLLPEPLKFTLLDGLGDGGFFATNDMNFGGNATLTRIAATGGRAQGLRLSTVGGKALAVSCRESFWDINFMLAGLGATGGDKIRLYMIADQNGKGAFDLARFEVTPGGGGVNLKYLEPSSALYANGHIQQNVNAFIPYSIPAGSSGNRTDQITIALSMDAKAPTMKCLHLVAEITRDGGNGTTSLVFNTIVLSREGAFNGTGTGLFTGTPGKYPTRADCDGACPVCDR